MPGAVPRSVMSLTAACFATLAKQQPGMRAAFREFERAFYNLTRSRADSEDRAHAESRSPAPGSNGCAFSTRCDERRTYFKLSSIVAHACATPESMVLLPGITAQPPFSTNVARSHELAFFNSANFTEASALR
jgi:hypothetical protein